MGIDSSRIRHWSIALSRAFFHFSHFVGVTPDLFEGCIPKDTIELDGDSQMLKATAGIMLPTTITGSLPRPSWYTENLGTRSFLDAMVTSRFREQYVDALSVYLREQEVAGLDIVTDGDCRFDQDIGGQSWTSYPPHHMAGFETAHPKLAKVGAGDRVSARAHPARLPGSAGDAEDGRAGRARRDAVCGAVQGGAAADAKPVKFGTVTPELVAFAVQDEHYKSLPDRIMAISDAFNEELHDLADAGCPVIQMEEPQIHLLAARNYVDKVINPEFMLKVFNNTVKGLRARPKVWCHTCWGNPSQQRMFGSVQSYKPALALLNQVDADVITFEMKSSNLMDLEEVGAGDHGDEGVHRGDRPSHAAGGGADGGGGPDSPGAEGDPGRTAGAVLGLRHGPRGDEPAACVLQDGVAGAGDEPRAQGAGAAGGGEPGRGSEVLADSTTT